MLIPKTHWWQTRRRAAECYAELCRDTLIAVLEFVSIELDPNPESWASYVSDYRQQALLRALERRKRNK
jgi:hypothetical protein